jgi:Endonuclease/Exonuclease/phosphatase family
MEAIAKLSPDILVLNEYVHGLTRDPFVESLKTAGFVHVSVSNRIANNNQVLIASHYPFLSGGIFGPQTEDGGGESNFLHVVFAEFQLEVVGIRAPAYTKGAVLRDYWANLARLIRSTVSRRIIFVGDFNADPDVPSNPGAATLAALQAEGWHLSSPSGAWSFVSGTRIDHALSSPAAFPVRGAYVSRLEGIDLASLDKATRISDHAALVVEFHVQSDEP